MKNISKNEELGLLLDIKHILDSGANDIRFLHLIDNFLERRKLKYHDLDIHKLYMEKTKTTELQLNNLPTVWNVLNIVQHILDEL